MALPTAKLASLVLKSISKPIAARLKQQAGVHPKFRNLIVSLAQVAGGLVIFEVQRSARSEARKEEKRRQEIEEIKQREDNLLKELEVVRQRISEFERLSRGSGLAGILKFRQGQTTEATNPV
ncbi:OPA3-like protein [Carex littledalei]|uniref:OPA3-like protein n=1 Tax=Carex littledalei TaxID=544730 RepID=A0A833R0E2_9POAL|nr:OPA3-like protein [Carex littledalei]